MILFRRAEGHRHWSLFWNFWQIMWTEKIMLPCRRYIICWIWQKRNSLYWMKSWSGLVKKNSQRMFQNRKKKYMRCKWKNHIHVMKSRNRQRIRQFRGWSVHRQQKFIWSVRFFWVWYLVTWHIHMSFRKRCLSSVMQDFSWQDCWWFFHWGLL